MFSKQDFFCKYLLIIVQQSNKWGLGFFGGGFYLGFFFFFLGYLIPIFLNYLLQNNPCLLAAEDLMVLFFIS